MKIKPSMAFEDMRGSAGSVTASKNKSRLYLKRHITPRNPRTGSQLEARERLSRNSRAWVELTQEQRDAWIEAAKTYIGKRILGEAAKLSGINAYSRINNNLNLIGQSNISVPPAAVEFPQISVTGLTIGGTPNALNLTITPNTAITGMTMVVQATPILSPGRQSMPKSLRVIGTYTVAAGGAINITADYQAKYGVLPEESQKVQVEIYLIDNASGLSSLRVGGTFLVAAQA